jgi:hypothetical protein
MALLGGVFAVLLGVGVIALVVLPQWAVERSVRGALSAWTSGEVSVASVSLSDEGAVVTGLAVVTPAGEPVLEVDLVEIRCDPSVLAEPEWHLEQVVLEGVRVTLRETPSGALDLPPTTTALVWGDSGLQSEVPRVAVEALIVTDVRVEGTGASGVLSGALQELAARSLRFEAGAERPVAVDAAELRGLASTVDGAPLLSASTLTLASDGQFAVEALDLALEVQPSGLPVWPPIVELAVPDLAGGRRPTTDEATRDWWGMQPATWVWMPVAGRASGRAVVTDRFIATRPATWTVTGFEGSIGPMKTHLPWSVRGRTAGGPVSVSGDIRKNGRVTGRVNARELAAAQFAPYLAWDLDKVGVEIREGTLSGDLDWSLQGSRFDSQGTVSLYNVRFNRTSAFSGLNKAFLTTASWLAGGKDRRFTTDVAVRGDFRDPRFSPFRQLFGQVGTGILADARDRAGQAATTVTGAAKKAWKSVFR